MRRSTSKRKRSLRGKIRLRLVLFLIITVIVIIYYFVLLLPRLECESKARTQTVITGIINTAVAQTLAEKSDISEGFTVITRNENGEVTSVSADAVTVNAFKTVLTEKILTAIDSNAEFTVSVPIGTLTQFEPIYGKGFPIKSRVCPTKRVDIDIGTDFCSTGINQSVYSVKMTVHIYSDIVLPTEIITAESTDTVVICQTVIVGKVPEIYASQQNGGLYGAEKQN